MPQKNTAVKEFRAGIRAGEGIRRHHKTHRKKFELPLAVLAGFVPLATDLYCQIKDGNIKETGKVLVHNTIGFNSWSGKWDADGLKTGLFPIAAGFLVHWLIGSKLGVNRMLARTGVPFIRI
jgi:hypothetical protein